VKFELKCTRMLARILSRHLSLQKPSTCILRGYCNKQNKSDTPKWQDLVEEDLPNQEEEEEASNLNPKEAEILDKMSELGGFEEDDDILLKANKSTFPKNLSHFESLFVDSGP